MSEIYVYPGQSITDAVLAARDGDTIYLCNGAETGETTLTKEGVTIKREPNPYFSNFLRDYEVKE